MRPAGDGGNLRSQWVEVFHGEIDDLDAASDVLTFTGRDYGGARMQDTFIEVERVYGAEGATTPVETVMQSILTDNGLPFVLQIPAGMTPGWELSQYRQQMENRPRCAPGAGRADRLGGPLPLVERLRLGGLSSGAAADEDRLPDWTFCADDYEEVSTFRTDRTDVRNVWEVVYQDKGDLDNEGQPEEEDGSSPRTQAPWLSTGVAGRRLPSRTALPSTPTPKPQRMANAALADTKDVLFEKTIVDPDYHFGARAE